MVLSLTPLTATALEQVAAQVNHELSIAQASLRQSLEKFEKPVGGLLDYQIENYLADQLNFLSNLEYISGIMHFASLTLQTTDGVTIFLAFLSCCDV